MSKMAAYKQSGHKYLGRNTGRGGRENSKLYKALKGIASFDVLDAVARDDKRRARDRFDRSANEGNS
jgi:hypothetical protein